MNQKLKKLIYAAILFSCGLYFGIMIGSTQVYTQTLTDQLFQGVSTNLNLHLKLLDLLQSNEKEKVAGKLEALIDCDLIALADYTKVPVKLRSPEILKSIEKAKAYRIKHPSTTSSPEVAAEINKALNLVK